VRQLVAVGVLEDDFILGIHVVGDVVKIVAVDMLEYSEKSSGLFGLNI
jgi:hypothetical protein